MIRTALTKASSLLCLGAGETCRVQAAHLSGACASSAFDWLVPRPWVGLTHGVDAFREVSGLVALLAMTHPTSYTN